MSILLTCQTVVSRSSISSSSISAVEVDVVTVLALVLVVVVMAADCQVMATRLSYLSAIFDPESTAG